MGIPEKIKSIQEEIHKTQINKATEYHIGLLKAKIAKLKREQEENTHGKTVSTGGGSAGFDVRKAGDATVVLIGFPSVGKSTLLNSLTNAKSKTGAYSFTTLTAIPGMMEYRGAQIQILDLPGIIEGASSGKGLGKRVLSVARNANLVLIVLDVFQTNHLEILKKELFEIGIKVDEKPPDVFVEKTTTGGISVNIQAPVNVDENFIRNVMRINGIHNGRITIKEKGLTVDQLIDVLSGNRVYIPSLAVINKIDLVDPSFLQTITSKLPFPFIPVSADTNTNIELLKKEIYNKLDFIRIYMKPKGKEADFKEPLIMPRGSTVQSICNKIHRNMVRDFKFAQIWGKSVKFEGQKVGLDHKVIDEDILTIVKRINAL
ncbi:MAG: GTP-binding protein [Thermoproteota archaeon]|nr:GTP-binding protein [Thermoproteota archaeon]